MFRTLLRTVIVSLVWVGTLHAQAPTVIRGIVDVDVDLANYTRTTAQGVEVVSNLVLEITDTNGVAVLDVDLKKPIATPSTCAAFTVCGHVGPLTVPQIAGLKDGTFRATMTAVGPSGVAKSPFSDPFVIATPVPMPVAPGKPTIK